MPSLHGIQTTEVSDGSNLLSVVSTSIIGMVVTAPGADAAAFPLDTPVLITDIEAAIGKAGATGTMRNALRLIASQARPIIVLVRVAPGADTAGTNAAVIGAVSDAGVKTGMQALTAAESVVGVKPRILGAPGLDTLPVATAFIPVAQTLRARAYCAAIGDTVAAAVLYRANFDARELSLIYGDVQMTDATGATVTGPATAVALGLRAAIDIDRAQGFSKTISNVAIQGIVGLTKHVSWDMSNTTTDAGVLNGGDVVAIVRTSSGGYRFWGNRTCSSDADFVFESAVRTAQVLLDTIAEGLIAKIDQKLRPSLIKSILGSINRTGRQLVTNGDLIGMRAWFDPAKNTSDVLAAGQAWVSYDYTPNPPLEGLNLIQQITDSYLADFSASLSS